MEDAEDILLGVVFLCCGIRQCCTRLTDFAAGIVDRQQHIYMYGEWIEKHSSEITIISSLRLPCASSTISLLFQQRVCAFPSCCIRIAYVSTEQFEMMS